MQKYTNDKLKVKYYVLSNQKDNWCCIQAVLSNRIDILHVVREEKKKKSNSQYI